MPSERDARTRWLDVAATVAAYRDRYKVTSDLPVGGGASNEAQAADRRSARVAVRSTSAGQALRPLNSPSFEPTDSPTIETLSR